MIVRPGEAAPAFACAEEDCERLAWLPAGANVTLIAEVEGRTLEDNGLWYEVLLDCPCFDYEHRFLENAPVMSVSATGSCPFQQRQKLAGPCGSPAPRHQPGWRARLVADGTLSIRILYVLGCRHRDAADAGACASHPSTLLVWDAGGANCRPTERKSCMRLTGNLRGRLKRWGGTEQQAPPYAGRLQTGDP